jgi:hypothetical protein
MCQSLYWLQKHEIFWVGKISKYLHNNAKIILLRTLAQRCRRFSPLLAAPAALLLIQVQAKAFLTYNIFESGGNVVVQTSGSLDLTGATIGSSLAECGVDGAMISAAGLVCTGTNTSVAGYAITGPSVFNGTVSALTASSVSGIYTQIYGSGNSFYIDPAYTSATPIVSSATFNGETLASLGFTTTGLIGTWTLKAPVSRFRCSSDHLLHQEQLSPAPCPCSAPLPPSVGAAASASALPLL